MPPIYEYICEKCGYTLEIIQKMSDEPLTFCPVCNEEKLKKLISGGGFRIGGRGVYKPTSKMD